MNNHPSILERFLYRLGILLRSHIREPGNVQFQLAALERPEQRRDRFALPTAMQVPQGDVGRPRELEVQAALGHLIPGGLGLWQVAGFRCGAAYAGLKRPRKGLLDVGVLWAPNGASAAAVFTVNQAAAAPVSYSRRVAAGGRASAVVVNSGNANACTGEQGLRDVEATAAAATSAFST
jgi:hypothetical protein